MTAKQEAVEFLTARLATVPCPKCGRPCPILPHDSAYCGLCFYSFRPSKEGK